MEAREATAGGIPNPTVLSVCAIEARGSRVRRQDPRINTGEGHASLAAAVVVVTELSDHMHESGQVVLEDVPLFHAVFQIVGAARDVVGDIAGDARARCAVDGKGPEIAAVHCTILEVGLAGNISHHVEMERVPPHDVFLANPKGLNTTDVAPRALVTEHVCPESGCFAQRIASEDDTAREQRHLCSILRTPVVAVLQGVVESDPQPIRTDSGHMPHLVFMLIGLIGPRSGHNDKLLTDLPVHWILQRYGRNACSRRRSEADPRWGVLMAEHVQFTVAGHNEALRQVPHDTGRVISGAGEGDSDAAGFKAAGR
mmetsp:Transcript_50277/g.107721  ORF Transcript_50277/g.107721 Transcript_50277/m.107721 type:complete len:313 (-) Transcript_50277:618-1556(-)